MWYDYSATQIKHDYWFDSQYNVFASVEPILEPIFLPFAHWIIIGAETGNQKGKITPDRGWIENLCDAASTIDIPVFMKDSLIPVVGEAGMRREFPWKIKI